MATWTTPKTWQVGEALTANDMNTYISDNLDALLEPPTDSYVCNEASNYTTTSTSFVDVDATNLALSVTPRGDTVMIGFNGAIYGSLESAAYLDVEQDDGGTPIRVGGDDGIIVHSIPTAGDTANFSFVRLVTGLTPETTYTFSLQWRTNAGTLQMWAGDGTVNADMHPQFWVREVS